MVIGAGGCGMVAALVAAQHGARVALLEKTDSPGGGTALSSKGIRSDGTHIQKEFGIDAAGLEQSVLAYNASEGKQDAFGRTVTSRLTPHFYYGIKVTVALHHTQGGIRVTADAEVLRKDGTVIPNLYTGGVVAAGVSGDGMDGYLPGNGQLASLGFGFIAGGTRRRVWPGEARGTSLR